MTTAADFVRQNLLRQRAISAREYAEALWRTVQVADGMYGRVLPPHPEERICNALDESDRWALEWKAAL